MGEILTNILIITDRLLDFAESLNNYLATYGNNHKLNLLATVASFEDALIIHQQYKIDVIVLIGYQKNSRNYFILDLVPNAIRVLWATVDRLTRHTAYSYQIPYVFEKLKGPDAFVKYLELVIEKEDGVPVDLPEPEEFEFVNAGKIIYPFR